MKDILVDLCLVGLLLFFINTLFNNNHIQNEIFQQNIISFEEDINNEEVIDYNQGVYDNQEDNYLSKCLKTVSEWCIKLIQIIMLIISNFISKLL